MTDQPTVKTISKDDRMLRAAYVRMEQYNRAALKLKNQHVSLRAVVLLLGFAASFLAVILSSGWQLAPVGLWIQLNINFTSVPILGSLLQSLQANELVQIIQATLSLSLILFLLPLAASLILAYATPPMPNMSWVRYRYSAEMIRRGIYQYCMNAGKYGDPAPSSKEEILRQVVADADNYSGANVDLIQVPKHVNAEDFTKILWDTCFKQRTAPKLPFWKRWREEEPQIVEKPIPVEQVEITFDDYFRSRFEAQLYWYVEKASTDYKTSRHWQVCGLIVGGFGTFLAINYAPWIAVTTAAAVTIGSLASLKMYGRTYSVYLIAAQKQHNHLYAWNCQPSEMRNDEAKQADFITNSETIFQDEIDTWAQVAEQTLSKAEYDMMQRLGQPQGSSTTLIVTDKQRTQETIHQELLTTTLTTDDKTMGGGEASEKKPDEVVGEFHQNGVVHAGKPVATE